MNSLPLSQVSGIVGAGPLFLVSTSDGVRRDVMTLAWHSVHDFSPPLVGIVMGADHFSRELLEKSRSCVLAIPGADLATLAVKVGTVSGRDCDKFEKFGIATQAAETVPAPLLADCLVNLECRVVEILSKYEYVILEVVRAWENPDRADRRTLHHRGGTKFFASGEEMDLAAVFPKK
jgi:flavin reductase (DIM6/NTAB) family NADH-FMN oxidoreductase RutF